MAQIQWSEALVLGLAPMDATHQEFVAAYNAMAEAAPNDFLVRFDTFIAHCEAHFDQENQWMAAVDFPGCHKGEHDRALAVMYEVRKHVVAGDLFLGRRLVEELPGWFESHATGMDAALVFHLGSIGYNVETGSFGATSEHCRPEGNVGCACAVVTDDVSSTV